MDNWMYQPSAAASNGRAPSGDQNLSAFRDPPSPETKATPAAPRVRRRNRLINSCLECRRRKLKCDKQAPCTNCTRFKRDCLYLAPALDAQSQQKLADIKEKMGALEKNLEREIVSQSAKTHMGGANVSKPSGATAVTHIDDEDEDEEGPEDEEGLEPTPLAALDNVYEDNNDDELMDLGVQLGKMRISERIGGFIRPKLVDELTDTLEDVTGTENSQSATASQPFSQQSARSGLPLQRIQASPKSYIGPGPDYIAPASSFFFPGTNMNSSLLDYLPSKQAADVLNAQYFHAVHLVAPCVHRQTFEAVYTLFWGQIATGTEPMPSTQAVIFAAMFTAAVSMTDEQVTLRFGTSKAALIDSLRSGTEMALSKANFLRTTKLDTMQAFVMYLVPLIRAEVSRAHSALVGTAIRLAECMGLHRDGSHYNMTPVEVHVRRLLWHQLCFLDMRTCEATGPRPQIRRDDYDTRFPLNVNDTDLLESPAPTADKPYWTDMTVFRIRCEFIDLRRGLWFDIVQIDKKKKSLTSALIKIQKLRSSFNDRFVPMIDDSVPIQRFAKHILNIGISGCFLQVLHRYLFSTTTRMPDRLRQILIEAGLGQLENSIALETIPDLAPWAWYKGAFNQYHAALLLMVEVYAYPMRKDAAKIWNCLDFIFDIPRHLSPKQKAELVISDVRDRMQVYHDMRKLRITTQMEERVQSLHRPSKSEAATSPPSSHSAPATREAFNMPPGGAMSMAQGMLPANFSPPPPAPTESSGSGSRQGSVAAQGDVPMAAVEDIDWAEWDKYFPIEHNSGDLNIPDFNFADFVGGLGSTTATAPPFPPTTTSGISIPPAEDLADVNFTPAYYVYNRSAGQNMYNQ